MMLRGRPPLASQVKASLANCNTPHQQLISWAMVKDGHDIGKLNWA
jgi:hypothetical protein